MYQCWRVGLVSRVNHRADFKARLFTGRYLCHEGCILLDKDAFPNSKDGCKAWLFHDGRIG